MASPAEPSLETWRAVLRAALYILLLVSPLPFGSVQPWAVLALQFYAALLGGLALLILGRDPAGLSLRARCLLIPVGLVWTIGLIQLLPGPRAWVRLVASPATEMRGWVEGVVPEIVSALNPQSIAPASTLDAWLRLTAYVLIALSAAQAVRTEAHLRQTALVLTLSAAFQGLYGSVEYLSGHQHIFAYAKRAFSNEASGTFINQNHFAGYLTMVLPLALGLVLDQRMRRRRTVSWRSRIIALAEPRGLMAAAGGLAAAVIWIGVIFSYSRSGFAVALVAMGSIALIVKGRRRTGLLVCVLVLPLVWVFWQGVRPPAERFFSEGEGIATVGGRLPVWRASLEMIPDYPALGTGIGTFEDAFYLYRPPTVQKIWDHAHNDWLQLATEGGLLSTLAVMLALFFALTRRFASTGSAMTGSVLSWSVAVAIVSTAVIGMVDFSLRIPANAVLLAVLLGVCTSAVSIRGSTSAVAAPIRAVASGPDSSGVDAAP